MLMIFYYLYTFLGKIKIQEESSDQLKKVIEDNRKLKNKVISLQTFAQRNKYKMKQMKRKVTYIFHMIKKYIQLKRLSQFKICRSVVFKLISSKPA